VNEYWSWLVEFTVQEIFYQKSLQGQVYLPNGKLIYHPTTPGIAFTPLRKLWLSRKIQALERF
jgi:hypothetical protein